MEHSVQALVVGPLGGVVRPRCKLAAAKNWSGVASWRSACRSGPSVHHLKYGPLGSGVRACLARMYRVMASEEIEAPSPLSDADIDRPIGVVDLIDAKVSGCGLQPPVDACHRHGPLQIFEVVGIDVVLRQPGGVAQRAEPVVVSDALMVISRPTQPIQALASAQRLAQPVAVVQQVGRLGQVHPRDPGRQRRSYNLKGRRPRYSRAIMAMASFSRSMNGSPETSTIALAIVPPVKGKGLVPG
jgi:hypothetical protein